MCIFSKSFSFTIERSYVDLLTSVEERADNRRREGLQSLDEYERRGWGFRAMGMKNVPRGPPYNSIYPDTRSGDGIRSSSNEMYEVRRQPLGIGITVLYII